MRNVSPTGRRRASIDNTARHVVAAQLNQVKTIRKRQQLRDWLKIAGFSLLIIVVIFGVVAGVKAHNARKDACHSKGGHVTHTTSTHYHTDRNGHVGSSTDTTYYCATDHGIIDVWG